LPPTTATPPPCSACCGRAGRADTKLRTANGKSALQLAREQGHRECVEAFRQHIADVTANHREAAAGGAGGASSGEAASSGSLGNLPEEAMDAAFQGEEAALLAWLDSGGQVNATCRMGDVSGVTALMLAAVGGHERAVELLLQRSAEIDQQDSIGVTALMGAALNGHERVIDMLLENGAER